MRNECVLRHLNGMQIEKLKHAMGIIMWHQAKQVPSYLTCMKYRITLTARLQGLLPSPPYLLPPPVD